MPANAISLSKLKVLRSQLTMPKNKLPETGYRSGASYYHHSDYFSPQVGGREGVRKLAGSEGRDGDRDRSNDQFKCIDLASGKELLELLPLFLQR